MQFPHRAPLNRTKQHSEQSFLLSHHSMIIIMKRIDYFSFKGIGFHIYKWTKQIKPCQCFLFILFINLEYICVGENVCLWEWLNERHNSNNIFSILSLCERWPSLLYKRIASIIRQEYQMKVQHEKVLFVYSFVVGHPFTLNEMTKWHLLNI